MDHECADQYPDKTSERVEKSLCENWGVDWNQVEKVLIESALEGNRKGQRAHKRSTQNEKRSKEKGNR